jgi:hypothetical protein
VSDSSRLQNCATKTSMDGIQAESAGMHVDYIRASHGSSCAMGSTPWCIRYYFRGRSGRPTGINPVDSGEGLRSMQIRTRSLGI